MRNLNVRVVVYLFNVRMGFVFVLSIIMEMDIIVYVSYKVKMLGGVGKIDYCFCLI